ncbi:hypothetical protein Pla108_14140 [Botrimarina colliarenosi]|uniref:Uncharacterized protein n=1 Tax=Botrimarina colliarenosi TaxID=2528001 RepID=A0A5C6AKA0_9BACT|nr:hypothetical protein Pla108_14140 [Botrimarina colliarenosi]
MTTKKPTTKYSITSAHRITGKSRTTIQKHVKQGKLSYEEDDAGVKWIDASELMRVYGDECDFAREEGGTTDETGPTAAGEGTRSELHSVRRLLDTLGEERQRERQQLQSQIDQLQSQIENLQDALKLSQEGHNRATLLLEDRTGGGEWRQAIQTLESKFAKRETAVRREAQQAARAEIKSGPWWALLRK